MILKIQFYVQSCLLVLSLFKTSSAVSQCSYYYDRIPPQTINCDPKGESIRLICTVLVSHDYPTSVKWFWNQAGPTASPGINEALITSDKYILESIIDFSANSDGLFGDDHKLITTNVTLPADSGYYWCQIVVNGTVLLQPPPASLINSSSLECPGMDFFYDLEPDQCATNEVEQIRSSHVTPVITFATAFIKETPDVIVCDPSSSGTNSPYIAVTVVALVIAAASCTVTLGLCTYIYCSKKRKNNTPINDQGGIHDAVSTQLELEGYRPMSPADNAETRRLAGHHSTVSTQLELQDNTTVRSDDDTETENDPQSVPAVMDDRPSVTMEHRTRERQASEPDYSEVRQSIRYKPTDSTAPADGKASADHRNEVHSTPSKPGGSGLYTALDRDHMDSISVYNTISHSND